MIVLGAVMIQLAFARCSHCGQNVLAAAEVGFSLSAPPLWEGDWSRRGKPSVS